MGLLVRGIILWFNRASFKSGMAWQIYCRAVARMVVLSTNSFIYCRPTCLGLDEFISAVLVMTEPREITVGACKSGEIASGQTPRLGSGNVKMLWPRSICCCTSSINCGIITSRSWSRSLTLTGQWQEMIAHGCRICVGQWRMHCCHQHTASWSAPTLAKFWHPSKHETFTQGWFNVGPAS